MRLAASLMFVLTVISITCAQTREVSIPFDAKPSPDARVENTSDRTTPLSFVTGSINGVRYILYHHNASGVVAGVKGNAPDDRDSSNWTFRCSGRKTTPDFTCVFYKSGIQVTMGNYILDRGSKIWIAATNYTGDSVLIDSVQVDGVKVYDPKNEQISTDALKLMGSGKSLTIHRGPDPTSVITHDLYGFNEALELCEWALKIVQ